LQDQKGHPVWLYGTSLVSGKIEEGQVRLRLIVLLMLSCVAISPGQMLGPPNGLIDVGIPRDQFDFFASAQRANEWCWAASIQMILNWYRLPVDQSQVVARNFGAPINQPGTDQQISASLNTWAIGVNGRTFAIRSVTAPGPPSATVLIQELNQQHPILLTFATGPFNGHAVVITGARYFPTNQGPIIDSIIIRDPWPSPENIQNKGRVEIAGLDLARFLPQIRSHWLVSVQVISSR
jgi:Papain-like cysteine protease AvrRpt2